MRIRQICPLTFPSPVPQYPDSAVTADMARPASDGETDRNGVVASCMCGLAAVNSRYSGCPDGDRDCAGLPGELQVA